MGGEEGGEGGSGVQDLELDPGGPRGQDSHFQGDTQTANRGIFLFECVMRDALEILNKTSGRPNLIKRVMADARRLSI